MKTGRTPPVHPGCLAVEELLRAGGAELLGFHLGLCWLSGDGGITVSDICRRLKVGKAKFYRLVRQLKNLGLLAVEKQVEGQKRCNRYHVFATGSLQSGK